MLKVDNKGIIQKIQHPFAETKHYDKQNRCSCGYSYDVYVLQRFLRLAFQLPRI